MRAAWLVVLVAAVASADPSPTAVGYDHRGHDRALVLGGGEALPCTRCHALAKGLLVGKPGHASCFGACHGAPPRPPRRGGKLALDRVKVCTACHAEAALIAPYTGTLRAAYPPYAIDPDFNLAIGHEQHAAIACTSCHTAPGGRASKPAPHARCAGCHDGASGHGAAMDQCAGCHPPGSGKPQPPELAALHDTVATEFSHPRHAARSAAGKDCMTCHAAIATTDDSELPRPGIATCAIAGCHDGTSAFATTEACTRCHTTAPDRYAVVRPTARFQHAGPHAQVVKDRPCTACHALAGTETAVAGHAACVGGACHTKDFGEREPKICGACHNATEPWRPLVADRALPARTEFGATLDHRSHRGACTSCHVLRTEATQLRTPRGHVACTSAGCHAAAAGPAPRIGECAGCHQLGRADARESARAKDPWSVRRLFDHAAHPGACTTCHVDMTAADVVALASPPKPTCAPCHDGKTAFKLTGTCTRCHPGAHP
ncbi:MAG TPA: cytochrome c3 family protein [Kofleriaceae bacterium]|nr:cytochrome c3 family protein [Kofleriaceae bacterium]